MGHLDLLAADVRRAGLSSGFPNDSLPNEEDVAAFESKFGLALPSDYRWFLLNHAGPETSFVYVDIPVVRDGEVADGQPSAFYQSVSLSNMQFQRDKHLDYLIDAVDLDGGMERPWWTLLLPIHPFRHSHAFFLDFRHDPMNPPVIWIDYTSAEAEVSCEPGLLYWAKYVAPSFTEMVKQARVDEDPDRAAQSDIVPYRHSDKLFAWRKSFAQYVSQFHELAERPFEQRRN